MNTQFSIKKTFASASLIGLVVLLLLSPCKIRNSVQAALDLPQTEVSNKTTCQVFEEIENAVFLEKYAQQKLIAKNSPHTSVAPNSSAPFPTSILGPEESAVSATSIPYYILYQNLKLHLSFIF